VYFACQKEKRDLLVQVLQRPEVETALVFTRTKYGADKVARYLNQQGIKAEAIHGNKTQPQRDRAMNGFRQGKINVLIATDIAARGIDVDALSHVINFEIPNISETYVHRIGRTGRAGLTGHAISFCNEDEERTYLRDIQKLIQRELPTELYGNYPIELGEVGMTKPRREPAPKAKAKNNRGGNNRGDGRSQGGTQRNQYDSSKPASKRNDRNHKGGGNDRNDRNKRPQQNSSNQRNDRNAADNQQRPSRRMGQRTSGDGSSTENRHRPTQAPKSGNQTGRPPRNKRNRPANEKPTSEQNRSKGESQAPRQFGRSTPPANRKPEKSKGFSLGGFFGFGKSED